MESLNGASESDFQDLDQALSTAGPAAAIDRLVSELTDRKQYRPLLDALLLKARHELGLPIVAPGSLNDLPEPARSKYEDRYVEAIRFVGGKMLAEGDIAGAWPYFRAIAEKDPVASAIEAYRPDPNGDERLGQIVEVAFNEGVHPSRGFDLILDNYGACSAITAFEGLPRDADLRRRCAARLTKHLHESLIENLRADIERRGQPTPPETASVADHLAGRDWLLEDDAYHIDVSHLMSVVRLSTTLEEPADLRLALGLTDYGRRLSSRHKYEGDAPFQDVYEDHGVYLRAILGHHADEAVAHFTAKIDNAYDERERADCAQVLVRLLVRLDRPEAALDVAARELGSYPESMLSCPGVAALSTRLGKPDRLADVARSNGDLVGYLSARLTQAG